jgi:hypothetical protein
MSTEKRTSGRLTVPDHLKKKPRAFTMSDAQYEELFRRARKENKSVGAYVVEKLGL